MTENQKHTESNSEPERDSAQRVGFAHQDGPAQRAFVRKKRFVIPLLILILASVAVALYWRLYLSGYASTNNAYIDGDPVTVSSKILGRVTQLTVNEGDAVEEGQLLVQLGDTDLKAQETQSKAGLELTLQSVSVAKIGLDRARSDFERASMQNRDGIITSEQYDHARQALEMAEAQYKVALSQVNNSRAQLGIVETQLKNTSIVAPASGLVARKWVMPGDIAQPGQPIFTIYDLNNIWITANFEETKLASIHLNDPVRISVDAYPDRELTGRVLLIGAAAASEFSLIPPNNASGNFTKVTQRVPVKISIESPNHGKNPNRISLLPGMSVEVKIRVIPK